MYPTISHLIYDLFDHLSLTITNKEHIEKLLNIDYKTDLKNKKNVIVIFFLKLIIQILLMIMMAKKRPSTLSCQGLL